MDGASFFPFSCLTIAGDEFLSDGLVVADFVIIRSDHLEGSPSASDLIADDKLITGGSRSADICLISGLLGFDVLPFAGLEIADWCVEIGRLRSTCPQIWISKISLRDPCAIIAYRAHDVLGYICAAVSSSAKSGGIGLYNSSCFGNFVCHDFFCHSFYSLGLFE